MKESPVAISVTHFPPHFSIALWQIEFRTRQTSGDISKLKSQIWGGSQILNTVTPDCLFFVCLSGRPCFILNPILLPPFVHPVNPLCAASFPSDVLERPYTVGGPPPLLPFQRLRLIAKITSKRGC